jgi:hypothetical protein
MHSIVSERRVRRRPPVMPHPTRSNLLLSFPKSGRTWVSYLYAYYGCYRILSDRADAFIDRELTPQAHIYRPLEHPALAALFAEAGGAIVPPLSVGHFFEPQPYFELDVQLTGIAASRVGFLVRDPRDVVVSYFHHVVRRAEDARFRGKSAPAADVDISEFIRSELYGIRSVVSYLNQVIDGAPRAFEAFQTFYYEDLVTEPKQVFSQLLEFLGAQIAPGAVAAAVRRASFGNLQNIEIARRTRKRGRVAPDALRFRRGVPHSHRLELSHADVVYLDRVIDQHLHPLLHRYRVPSACDERKDPMLYSIGKDA